MAHRGKDTGGSQFFICHNRQGTQHLDGVHTCFGKVTGGLEFLDDIKGNATISPPIIAMDKADEKGPVTVLY